MQIEVTEFVRPHGKQIIRSVYIDNAYNDQYITLSSLGCRITVEIDGDSFYVCVEDSIVENDFITEIFNNFTAFNLITALHTVLDKFNVEDHGKWREVITTMEYNFDPNK